MAQKRNVRVAFADETDEDRTNRQIGGNEVNKKKKSDSTTSTGNRLYDGKYTLDSDEEDDEHANVKEMNKDELDEIGQEQTTIDFDDEIKITPFNVDEEMEEGHYDESGNYHWKKRDKEEVRDAWLDNVDWTNVKNYKFNKNNNKQQQQSATTSEQISGKSNEEEDDNTNNDDDVDDSEFNEMNVLKSMLEIMQPGETVVRAIKRLGANSNNKLKQRFRQKNNKHLSNHFNIQNNQNKRLKN